MALMWCKTGAMPWCVGAAWWRKPLQSGAFLSRLKAL
jgi:hypothetical protein